jgi:hypothetical protein
MPSRAHFSRFGSFDNETRFPQLHPVAPKASAEAVEPHLVNFPSFTINVHDFLRRDEIGATGAADLSQSRSSVGCK